MDTQELDDLTEDGDEVTAYRARARTELDQIARQTKQALAEQGLTSTVFFLVPNSGEAVLLFGTPADPDDLHGNELATSSRQSCGRWLGWMARGADQSCVVQPPMPRSVTNTPRR